MLNLATVTRDMWQWRRNLGPENYFSIRLTYPKQYLAIWNYI
jgi:hypothetical protein